MVSALPVYPAHPSLRESYAEATGHLAADVVAREFDRGWMTASEDVTFTAYDWNDHRTIYVLNVDWWSDATEREVTLHLGPWKHQIAARRGRIETITIAAGVAVWAIELSMDVVHVDRYKVRVQSDRGGRLVVFTAEGRKLEAFVSAGGMCDVVISA
jgi:hypothetical protein